MCEWTRRKSRTIRRKMPLSTPPVRTASAPSAAHQSLLGDEPTRLGERGITAQKYGQPEPQALDQLGVHRGDRAELLRSEPATAPRPPRGELQKIVRDDITGVFKIDHRRQDFLAPRALVLVIERLLVADVGEVMTDRGAES